jgi:hypothetical protein
MPHALFPSLTEKTVEKKVKQQSHKVKTQRLRSESKSRYLCGHCAFLNQGLFGLALSTAVAASAIPINDPEDPALEDRAYKMPPFEESRNGQGIVLQSYLE